MHKTIFALPTLLLAAACATGAEPVAIERDFTLVPQGEQTPQSRLYADCVGQATRQNTYGRSHDASTEMVRFNCDGAPARAFYEALDAWSLEQDTRWEHNGWRYRSTNRVQRDLFGVDWCASDGTAYACVINLNVGEFGTPR